MAERIIIMDTTLRDGEQTPGVNLNLNEKLKIAKKLEKLGVDVIEAGFPAASPGDFESVSEVSKAVNCCVQALCRCVKSDIETAWQAVKHSKKPRLHLFIATSPIHMEYKLRKTPQEVLKTAVECVTFAKTLCDDIEFSTEDGSRSNPDFLYEILEAVINAGATTLNIPDTVGYAMPHEYGELIKGICENVPSIKKAIISVHCHNDLGLAVANSLSALQNGARQLECTVNGLGERAGNAALEEIVMAIKTRKDILDFECNIETTRIYKTSKLVSNLTNIAIPTCKAIVGANAFAHESGIHQHGMLANSQTYEIITPESIGVKQSKLVLGKHSGRHAFDEHIKELGYSLSKEELDSAFADFKVLADKKKEITDRDLEALINQDVAIINDTYKLDSFQLQSGNLIKSIASVTLIHEGNELQEAAIGDGPVNAAYNAIERITKNKWPLVSYDIKAVTEGEDALGEVIAKISHNDKIYVGKGLAADIIESSIKAYINAINRALSN